MIRGRLRRVILTCSLILLLAFCAKAIYAQTEYRRIQEETNRESLVRQQVLFDDLARRVDLIEKTQPDVRLAKLEKIGDIQVYMLAGLCLSVGGLLLERLVGRSPKKSESSE